MEKTTLIKLIEKLDNEIKKVTLGGITYYGLIQAKHLAINLLADEKKDIKTAFHDGEQNVWDRERDGNQFEFESGEDYFNKNFNQEIPKTKSLWQS